MVAATHQAWLIANELDGRWSRPVFFAGSGCFSAGQAL